MSFDLLKERKSRMKRREGIIKMEGLKEGTMDRHRKREMWREKERERGKKER